MIDCHQTPDSEIVQKILSWDKEGFLCIVEHYQDVLFRYISRLADIPYEEKENLLQEVFIKVYQNLNAYNEKYSFSSWIYRITHNVVIDFYRKSKQKMTLSFEEDEETVSFLNQIFDEEKLTTTLLEKKELQKLVKKILTELKEEYKTALILKFIEGKNYEEISDILRIPEGTVATYINRGKKEFKEKAEQSGIQYYLNETYG